MTHKDVVKEVRLGFPAAGLYPERSAEFLVALCKRLRGEFPGDFVPGLRLKAEGTHTTLPSGTPVALDIVMYPDGMAYDVLVDSERVAEATWALAKGSPLPKEWYVPIPGGPGPTPTPTPPTDLTEVLARLRSLDQKLTTTGQVLVTVAETMIVLTRHVEAVVEALETLGRRPAPTYRTKGWPVLVLRPDPPEREG